MRKNGEKISLTPLLVDISTAARICGMSRSLFYTSLKAGLIGPCSVSFGTKRLFSLRELQIWTDGGCAPRRLWASSQILNDLQKNGVFERGI
jgi:hypothetical protein